MSIEQRGFGGPEMQKAGTSSPDFVDPTSLGQYLLGHRKLEVERDRLASLDESEYQLMLLREANCNLADFETTFSEFDKERRDLLAAVGAHSRED